MIEKVKNFIHRHQLLKQNAVVLVGVSGGPDSLALLHLLWSMKDEWNIFLVAAHVDHMFRGKESEDDLHFVVRFCRELGIRCETKQINVKEYQLKTNLTAQEAARECRYQFFKELMEKYQADFLALGHHGDDQIETILMRLTRGSTQEGYAGIKAKRPFATGHIIRPLLAVSKSEIEAYCRRNNLEPRRDPSNEKDVYTRNRFRHHILPFLKDENPNVHEKFQQFSERMTEDENLLEELTKEKMNTVIKEKSKSSVIMNRNEFCQLPLPLQRRGIQLILNYLYEKIPSSLSSVHIENVLSFLSGEHPSGTLHFPKGLKIVRSYDIGVFRFEEKKGSPFYFTLSFPSRLPLSNGYEIISTQTENFPDEVKGNDWFVIDPDDVTFPLIVRNRRQGDRMKVKGMNGTKKVKTIFIDEKIPLEERDQWPIVEDADGNILWIPGLKKSIFEATNIFKNNYIVLQYKKQ
jgi:tRNA(Ile)-lysidine synthase